MVEAFVARLPDAGAVAPLLAFLAGALLSVSPVSLPSVPVVISAVSPQAASSERRWARVAASFPAVLAFVFGMDDVLGMVGLAIVEVAELFTRSALVLHLVAAVLLAGLCLRLLPRRATLCHRARALPPHPQEAFVFAWCSR